MHPVVQWVSQVIWQFEHLEIYIPAETEQSAEPLQDVKNVAVE